MTKHENTKCYSAAAERNREAILEQLLLLLPRTGTDKTQVLELGSGTGQHVCYFAPQMPDVVWQPSDVASIHPGLSARLQDEDLDNIREPMVLDVFSPSWPVAEVDVVYTSNTFHILSERGVECTFKGAAKALTSTGCLIVYGPFSRNGVHNAESNIAFDHHLRLENPERGIRDLNWLNSVASEHGFETAELTAMPANNFIALWRVSGQR